jgi:hypothetical protein
VYYLMDCGLFTSGSAEPTESQHYIMHECLARSKLRRDLQIHDGTLQQLYAHGNCKTVIAGQLAYRLMTTPLQGLHTPDYAEGIGRASKPHPAIKLDD